MRRLAESSLGFLELFLESEYLRLQIQNLLVFGADLLDLGRDFLVQLHFDFEGFNVLDSVEFQRVIFLLHGGLHGRHGRRTDSRWRDWDIDIHVLLLLTWGR
jgi:hypothetical protein